MECFEVRKPGLTIVVIPARTDNYMYLLEWADGSALIDATDAQIARRICGVRNRHLCAILSTHHHEDHVGGNLDLQSSFNCPIYGPTERIPGLTHPLSHGDSFTLGVHTTEVIATPGHTTGCLSFYFPDSALLFTGDSLFAGGCGRLFECAPPVMYGSLSQLAALPSATEVYCGHEYTESNLRFALSVDPQNKALQTRALGVRNARKNGRATVPSTIAIELATNPFMRAADAVKFANLRQAKDRF